jgi:N-acetylglucosamine kinase-like BadF-type ATPase
VGREPVTGPRSRLVAVLAIDGGNSKTDVALVSADGALLATARGGGTNPQGLGADEAMRVLGELVTTAVQRAGLPAGGGQRGGPVAEHASACLAGADLPEEEQQLNDLIQTQGWSVTSSVVNDTFAVLRAGLDDDAEPWGVGVTCGAGINCVGVAPDGRTTRFLAFGELTGDWGGGEGLGRAAMWWAIRAEDGRGPPTALRQAVPAHFGVATVTDVAIGIHLGKIAHDGLRGLCPVLFEVAGRGDDVARMLVGRMAAEICAMALVAMRRLDLAGLAVPVALGGSLLTARDPLLTAEVARELKAGAPQAIMRIVDVPPVAGAALLGLDHVAAPVGAKQRLRAAYPSKPPEHRI